MASQLLLWIGLFSEPGETQRSDRAERSARGKEHSRLLTASIITQAISSIAVTGINGLDPKLYLHKVLERIPDHPISRIADLLPRNLSVAKT